ncbi:MAG: rhodanese-like domain-containing protein [Bacteroidales bacterium]|nr:rhodanese-like domain-containing protein [Bacteroidales bacterium]
MNKSSILLVVLLVIGAFGTFIIDTTQREPFDKVQPCDLIDIIAQTNKFVTTDELARKIMSDDPTLTIIDLRSKTEYDKYSLSGAINIPLENLSEEKYEDVLNQDVRTVIFYSNSSDLAVKAWMLTSRLTYKNIFILQGGLNRWVETILKPKPPKETALRTEFEMYSFRRAASSYFGGGSTVGETTIKKKVALPIKRKKKSAAGGGCD